MANFYLSKNFAQPGDFLTINGSCIWLGTFVSSDESIATVTLTWVSVTGIWEVTIKENTLLGLNCSNTWGILLTSTEDWKPFFMGKEDYRKFTNYEIVFVLSLLFVAFLIRFIKRS